LESFARRTAGVGPKKMRRVGGVFVHDFRRLSACADRLREPLRPTRAPCSTQVGTYGVARRRARGRSGHVPLFAVFPSLLDITSVIAHEAKGPRTARRDGTR